MMKKNRHLDDLFNEIQSLYIDCMNCPNTVEQCPGIMKDIENGIPPRGFYCQTAPVDILVVAKNPGHPFQGESALYAGLNGFELYQAYRNFQAELYPDPDAYDEPSNRFHKNLFRYLASILDVPQSDIYLHSAHTNLVKCSTPEESAELDPQTVEECYQKYFEKELDLFQPKVLLALGREVEKHLLKRAWKHCLPVIYIRHPSYPYPKEEEKRILTGIKEKVHCHL